MFNELWKKRIRLIEDEILLELNRTNSIDQTLMDAMKYSLMSGGKRIRPILLMAAADAVNGSGDKFVTTASAIEMVHTYSLIHDDLPAMDNDDYRRGKLTNHKVYGEAMAILAGDALLTLAFEVMLRQRGVNHAAILFVIGEISQAIGAAGMVGGQAIDILSEGKKIDLETLRKMHLGKTGALFRAAIKSGAILA
ncbi:MAG: polyprenyl synthetase family protein, partial [Selenomonadaceae bacterium]|nr:polyprenyl synthetase family protein [Selenomonadaceae bacterium]